MVLNYVPFPFALTFAFSSTSSFFAMPGHVALAHPLGKGNPKQQRPQTAKPLYILIPGRVFKTLANFFLVRKRDGMSKSAGFTSGPPSYRILYLSGLQDVYERHFKVSLLANRSFASNSPRWGYPIDPLSALQLPPSTAIVASAWG